MAKISKTKETGDLGEHVALNYLLKRGFELVERNHWRKWGEIDLILRKNQIVHFVEVKTVSYETKDLLRVAVARGTWRPEEQVHNFKLKKFHRVIETWLSEQNYGGEWQIDVAAVRIVPRETYATVKYIENIVV